MAKTNTAVFAQNPKTATAVTTAAATIDTDTPTNTVLLCTAGTEGAIVSALSAVPRATSTASKLCLYLSKDSGTAKRFLNSALLGAYTQAATTASPIVDFGYTQDEPLRLEAGDEIYVGNMVALASGVVFTAQLTDF